MTKERIHSFVDTLKVDDKIKAELKKESPPSHAVAAVGVAQESLLAMQKRMLIEPWIDLVEKTGIRLVTRGSNSRSYWHVNYQEMSKGLLGKTSGGGHECAAPQPPGLLSRRGGRISIFKTRLAPLFSRIADGWSAVPRSQLSPAKLSILLVVPDGGTEEILERTVRSLVEAGGFAASAVLLAHTEPKLWIANLAETYDLSRLQASAEQGEDGSGDGSGGKEVGCTWKINWKWEVVFVC
eukprot:g1864.t1